MSEEQKLPVCAYCRDPIRPETNTHCYYDRLNNVHVHGGIVPGGKIERHCISQYMIEHDCTFVLTEIK